jgi:LemA protein
MPVAASRKDRIVTVFWIVLGIVVLVAIIAIVSYNRFISQKNLIRDSWANIDTELRRRYDLIPNLVETVKGYASHEKEVFEEVARTRSMAAGATGTPAAQAAAEGPFVAALGKLFAVAENYPELKANQNFLALQAELSNTEDRLQTARRFYNSNVRDYNRRVQSFPSVLIARGFGFKEAEFFEVDEALREAGAPQVNFGSGPAVSFGGGGQPGAAGTAPAAGGGPTPPASPPMPETAPPPPPDPGAPPSTQ